VCRIFTAALEHYGSPEELLTDNGKVFTGRLGPHPAEVLFDRICREHGITHRLTGIRAPTTTGKIERFHKTLRAELMTVKCPGIDGGLDGWGYATSLDCWCSR
jgi:transposase InsO family protein